MSRVTLQVATGLVAGACLLSPAVLQAGTRGVRLCTPGALRACHSISVTTVALIQGGQRVGTAVSLTVGNLSGSGDPNDNSQWSTLKNVQFSGPVGLPGGLGDLGPVTGRTAVGSGASLLGGGHGWEYFVPFTGDRVWMYDDLRLGVGGCQLPPPQFNLGGYAVSARTCGAGASIVLSFSTFAVFDAADFQSMTIGSHGTPVGGSADIETWCDVDFGGGNGGSAGASCLDVAITPEPVSTLLVATGLLGIGAVRRRRARKLSRLAAAPAMPRPPAPAPT